MAPCNIHQRVAETGCWAAVTSITPSCWVVILNQRPHKDGEIEPANIQLGVIRHFPQGSNCTFFIDYFAMVWWWLGYYVQISTKYSFTLLQKLGHRGQTLTHSIVKVINRQSFPEKSIIIVSRPVRALRRKIAGDVQMKCHPLNDGSNSSFYSIFTLFSISVSRRPPSSWCSSDVLIHKDVRI